MFIIDWVQAIATDGQVSEAKFGPHLNIIVGPSNCGKTMILKCIDYLLGASKPPFRKGKYPIERVQMKVITEDGYAILSRNIGADLATIESHTQLVRSGDYDTGRTRNSFNYGQMLMGLFGVPVYNHPTKIFRTSDAQTIPLSVRHIINTFIIKENPIINPGNILIPNQTPITVVKSALLYQLYGQNFITGNERDPNWVKDKKSLRRFISEKISDLTRNNDWLEMPICDGMEDTLNQQADGMVEDLDAEYIKIQEKYNEAVATFGELGKDVSRLSSKLAEDDDLLQKCAILKEQYEADVKRIRFSLEGKDKAGNVHEPEHCPFCGGEMQAEQEHDCLEASKNDLETLLPKISDLENEIISLTAERSQIAKDYAVAKKKYDDMDSFLNDTYRPQVRSIKTQIRNYGKTVREAQEKEIVRKEYEKARESLESVETELSQAVTEFNPTDHLGNLPQGVGTKLVEALTACHFPHSETASFDPEKFDIKIGDDTKSDFGKGFVAFLNSVLTYTLHQYLEENARYKGCPFIIDSPIMSLKEIEKSENESGSDIQAALRMKKPLFQYFQEKSRSSQTIIIENDVPGDVNYDQDTVFIRYGKGLDPELPYGFLAGQE